MEYKHVNGRVFCRYAFTPPIVNSELAHKYGIEAPSPVELEVGSNAKVRIVLKDVSKRMTCHAVIERVTKEPARDEWRIALGLLAFSDEEFELLLNNCVEEPEGSLEFGDSVRQVGVDSSPLTIGQTDTEITRVKAVTLPVSLIEAIDARRGDVPFSEFVKTSLWNVLAD